MIRHCRSALRGLLLLTLASSITACTLLPESEPTRLYLLPTATLSPAEGAALTARMRVETPHAPASLAGPRILVMPEPHRLKAYAGARWAERIPLLLRDRLVKGIGDRGLLRAQDDNSPLSADVSLASDLRAFYSEYVDGVPEAVIRLDAALVDETTRELLGERRFVIREPSTDTSLEAVVEAFGRAADRLAVELSDWSAAAVADKRREKAAD